MNMVSMEYNHHIPCGFIHGIMSWVKSPPLLPKIQVVNGYPLVMTNSLLLKMSIEIVDLPIEHGDFP